MLNRVVPFLIFKYFWSMNDNLIFVPKRKKLWILSSFQISVELLFDVSTETFSLIPRRCFQNVCADAKASINVRVKREPTSYSSTDNFQSLSPIGIDVASNFSSAHEGTNQLLP